MENGITYEGKAGHHPRGCLIQHEKTQFPKEHGEMKRKKKKTHLNSKKQKQEERERERKNKTEQAEKVLEEQLGGIATRRSESKKNELKSATRGGLGMRMAGDPTK